MTQIIIGNVDYTNKAQIGFVLEDVASQDKLDSLNLVISDVAKATFEPFTDVTITTPNNETYYFYVDTYVESQFDISNSTYSYDMSLISRTKILERVILTNRKIRKPISTDNMSIGDYIRLNVYPYIHRKFNFLTLDSSITDITAKCPDIEWSNPKAKDVINDLLMTIPNNPCYVRVLNNRIVCESLAEKGQDITQLIQDKAIEDTNYEQMSQFANSLIMDAKNIVSKQTNKHVVISPRAISQARLTTDNELLFLGDDVSIESITRVIVYIPDCTGRSSYSNEDVYTNVTLKADITEFVVESMVYKGLKVGSPTNADYPEISHVPPSRLKEYQVGCLTFTQNGNTIEGLSNHLSFWQDVDQTPAINNIISNKLRHLTDVDQALNPSIVFDGIGWRSSLLNSFGDQTRDVIYEIEFINNGEARLKINKEEPESKDCSLQMGQNQSTIDLKAAMQSLRESVNRLGNTSRPITLVLDYATDYIPKLRDYSGNYIVSSRQISYWHDFCIVKLEMTENFLQKHIYYGIANRKKFTQLAMQNESVVREENQYVKVDIVTNGNTVLYNNFNQYLASFFALEENKNIQLVTFTTDEMDGYASLYPTTYVGDKSVVITFQCADNYSIGMTVDSSNDYTQKYGRYTDDEGTIRTYRAYFYNSIPSTASDPSVAKQMPMYELRSDTTNAVLSFDDYFYKDNSETFKLTLQVDYYSSDKSVIIGTGIGRNNILAPNSSLTKCRFVIGKDYVDEKYPIKPADFRSYAITSNNNYFTVTHHYVDLTNVTFENTDKSWMLVDSETDEIVIAVNRSKQTNVMPTRIFLTNR